MYQYHRYTAAPFVYPRCRAACPASSLQALYFRTWYVYIHANSSIIPGTNMDGNVKTVALLIRIYKRSLHFRHTVTSNKLVLKGFASTPASSGWASAEWTFKVVVLSIPVCKKGHYYHGTAVALSLFCGRYVAKPIYLLINHERLDANRRALPGNAAFHFKLHRLRRKRRPWSRERSQACGRWVKMFDFFRK